MILFLCLFCRQPNPFLQCHWALDKHYGIGTPQKICFDSLIKGSRDELWAAGMVPSYFFLFIFFFLFLFHLILLFLYSLFAFRLPNSCHQSWLALLSQWLWVLLDRVNEKPHWVIEPQVSYVPQCLTQKNKINSKWTCFNPAFVPKWETFSFSFSVYPTENRDDGKMDFLPGRNFQYFGVWFLPLGILKAEIQTFITKVIWN